MGLLRDFGHLDDTTVDPFLVALGEAHPGPRESRVDLPQVRRFAAVWLHQADQEGRSAPHLKEDWPILFS